MADDRLLTDDDLRKIFEVILIKPVPTTVTGGVTEIWEHFKRWHEERKLFENLFFAYLRATDRPGIPATGPSGVIP